MGRLTTSKLEAYADNAGARVLACSSLLSSLALMASLLLMPLGNANAASVYYTFAGIVDQAKFDSADYGFSVGDVIRGTIRIDATDTPYSSASNKNEYRDNSLFVRFTVETAAGVLLYSSGTPADDIKLKLENNRSGKDKFEFEDKSSRAAVTRSGGYSSAFEKLKIKLENDDENAINSAVPYGDADMRLLDWPDKAEFELRFDSGSEDVKLQGDLSAFVVPVPAAVWLFGSGLGLLGWMRRKPA
ncbi:MAG: PEP-CTERM sorting domain-containing protein [Gammaproteobacteria bacterium]|nr:PEP-CTERM sorting domain-containing protein [Gammaproteobacteria bacterium]